MTDLVLFDIDATLLLSGGAGSRAMTRVGKELYGEQFRWEGIDPYGALDTWLFEQAAHRNGMTVTPENHAVFREKYIIYLEEELDRHPEKFRVMPGAVEIVESVHSCEGIILGLLTGNYTRSSELKLRAARIPWEWFQVIACGDDADTRPELVRIAMQRYRQKYGQDVSPARIVVIGDTPKDVNCAKENDCRCVAVATGKYTVSDLEQAGADLVVEDFVDPQPVLRYLGIS